MSGMKDSTIKKVLNKKINEWLDSLPENSPIRTTARENVIVSGGAISSMLAGDTINDYDFYFKTKEAALAIAHYYTTIFNNDNSLKVLNTKGCQPEVKVENKRNIRGEVEERIVFYMKSSGVAAEGQSAYQYFESKPEVAADEFIDSVMNQAAIGDVQDITIEQAEEVKETLKKEDNKYRPVFFTENAITLAGKIQLIVRFYGSPEKIHDNYDFVHCMCYYDFYKDELSVPTEALRSILSKSLVYKGSLYPLASMFRIRKFIGRGWRITAGQMLKIMMQISAIDLSDIYTLKEQLIGVDQAYMHQLIQAIETPTATRVDTTYIAKLIDEIFE